MSLFRLPKSPDVISVPAVLAIIYATFRTNAGPFPSIRSKLPLWMDNIVPILFWVHVAEALVAGYRSVRANRPATETLKWIASTLIWGFASLGTQRKMLKI